MLEHHWQDLQLLFKTAECLGQQFVKPDYAGLLVLMV
jgi:hypothetical protein